MKVLAIDCATERLALTAVDDDRAPGSPELPLRERCRIHALDLEGGASASARVVPAAIELLARLGWGFGALDAVAFGRGPGAFTGLRTACAVAQGFAFGRGLPVVPVDSLALVADDAAGQVVIREPGVRAWVVMDARMDELYAACFEHAGERGWHAVVAPALIAPAALNPLLLATPAEIVAGSGVSVFSDRLELGEAVRVPREHSRAHALGWLAAVGLARGDAVAADQALPTYLRDKVAQTTEERAAARAAAGGTR